MEEEKKPISLADFDADDDLLDSLEEESEEIEETKEEELEESEESPKEEVEEEETEESEEEEDTKEEEEQTDEEFSDFWEDVEQITGHQIDVDFGDTDPTSPEGAALRDQHVMKHAIDGFLEELQIRHPKVMQMLDHSVNGGDIHDLFKPGEKDYSNIVLSDTDEEQAIDVLKEHYSKKNFKPNKIKRLIAADVNSEDGVIVAAKEALEELKAEQAAERHQAIAYQKQMEAEQKREDLSVIGEVGDIISSGTLKNFKVDKKDKTEFQKFVLKGLQRDGKGGYVFVQPMDNKNLEEQLQYEFFKYKKGNLGNYIKTRAKTENVNRLKARVKKKEKETSQEEGKRKKVTSLRDI